MAEHRLSHELKCLNCGTKMDGATNMDGNDMPKVGDISVCLYCGHLMEFGVGLTLVQPSDKAILEIAGNKDMLMAMQISGFFRARYPKKD